MKILAISDQHGFLPDIPECDLLIVAGDNCPDYPPGARDRIGSGPQTERQLAWFKEVWMPWRLKQPVKWVVSTWGNHDYCGESVHKAGTKWFPNSDENTVCVVDDEVTIDGVSIWLAPWSSQFRDWAFMAEDWRLINNYKEIPAGIDILVSHQPPCGYGDVLIHDFEIGKMRYLGSNALKETVMRVKPKAVVCGHIHSGYGVSTITHYGLQAAETGQLDVTTVYNVAIVNEQYKMVNPPTEIVL